VARLPRIIRSRKVQLLLAVVLLLLAVRAVLPVAVKHYANKTLDELEGYSGHIEDVDLALIRGAYVIEGVRIVKTGGKAPVPFFSASKVDLSVQWGALLDGSIVSEIDVYRPKLNFVTAAKSEVAQKAKGEAKQEQIEPASNWTDVVKDLVPFNINRFSINDGEVHYRDFSSQPKVDIFVQDIVAEAHNLTNSEDKSGSMVATFEGRARAMQSGKIKFKGRVDPYAKAPTFQASAQLNGLELPQLNPYLRAFANVDVEKGTLALDSEFAAKDGSFAGYVKPFIDKLDVIQWEKEKESFPNKVWQALVEVTSEILQDQSKDRQAAKIPFEGRFDDPKVGVWSALGSLLKNAFVEALRRGLEGSVDIQKVAGDSSKDHVSPKTERESR
jgi:uncharacterized protein involved in outer membrane biogenesis